MGISLFSGCKPTLPQPTYKFRPGHYLAMKNGVALSTTIRDEIASLQNLRGARIRYFWNDLETSEGIYDFSSIDADLATLLVAGSDKRLIIMIPVRSFSLTDHVVPGYMRAGGSFDTTYGDSDGQGGEWEFTGSGNGLNIRMWNSNVKAKFQLFLQALAAQYDTNDKVEMISFTEGAIGNPSVGTLGFDEPAFYTNLLDCMLTAATAFTQTIVRIMPASPRDRFFLNTYVVTGKTFVQSCVDAKMAIGWPDTAEHDNGLWGISATNTANAQTPRGIYYHCATTDPFYTGTPTTSPGYRNLTTIAAEVQNTNYKWTNETRSQATPTTNALGGYAPTVRQIHDFLKSTFRPNYVFWTRTDTVSGITGNAYYQDVYNMLALPEFNADVSGGLNTARPVNI